MLSYSWNSTVDFAQTDQISKWIIQYAIKIPENHYIISMALNSGVVFLDVTISKVCMTFISALIFEKSAES